LPTAEKNRLKLLIGLRSRLACHTSSAVNGSRQTPVPHELRVLLHSSPAAQFTILRSMKSSRPSCRAGIIELFSCEQAACNRLGMAKNNSATGRDLNRSGAIVAVAIASMLLLSGCQAPRSTIPPEKAVVQPPIFLSAGDIVRITFPGAPELNQAQKIRVDGKISLPIVGEVTAAGKRPIGLQEELKALYKPQLQNSDLLVTLESGTVPVYLSGAVARPGRLVFDRRMSLLEVITQAGGLRPTANPRKVRIIRLENGEHRSQTVDMKPALSGRTAQAFYVRPNDVIHVEENFLNF